MHILVIDDEINIREMLCAMFETLGHTSESANDGLAGLAKCRTVKFDVIFCDIMMPNMSGLQFLEQLNETGETPPVIFVTAYAGLENATSALRLGAFDFLNKPVDMDNIALCLERIEKRNELHRQYNNEKEEKLKAQSAVETERRMRENLNELNSKLVENIEFLKTLLNTIPSPVYQQDGDGRILRCNQLFSQTIAGMDKEDIVGKTIGEIAANMPAECRFTSNNIAVLNNSDPDQSSDTRIKCADGVTRDFILKKNEQKDSDFGLICIMVDVTDIKRFELQLRQSEKMQAIGQLAAGVAHEINNPVGYIMSNLGTLKEYVAIFKKAMGECILAKEAFSANNQDAVRTHLEKFSATHIDEDVDFILNDCDDLLGESINGAIKVRDIVRSLKSFSRVDEKIKADVDINKGLESTLKVVWNELKYKCQIEKDLAPLPKISCNLGQLNQVFMNLFVNAAHAIPESGKIAIKSESTDESIIITIADTGTGIAPENLKRIFDPFFTTKPVGKGTGLGLSISHGIIEEHGGTITVESELGKGTTFTITLPVMKIEDEEKN
ncbi:MAG: response regulator [Planctomycetes bacterium]|nr:response regulator [Planctomycetota bacterium]